MAEPTWVQHAIWWQVYPLGFVGADTTGQDRTPARSLQRITQQLDYLRDLGCNGLALGPIFASSTHGYDTVDYYAIDPRLGSHEDFDDLITAAHSKGIKVLLDGVFNHVGRDYPDPPTDGTVFEGHDQLLTLDHTSQRTEDLVIDVMCHWLDRGADGWRLDAAYAVPLTFWSKVLKSVKNRYESAYLVGEVIHGDYAGIVSSTGMDAVTQYELWKAIWSSINDRNFFELAAALKRHNTLVDTFIPLTFVGNHDVTRLASKLTDSRHLAHALVILCTVAGTPTIYYGDEQAFTGIKEDRVGGDDAIRPEWPAELSGWDTFRLHQDLIGRRRRHPSLHAATSEIELLTNQQLIYTTGDLRVLLNLSDTDLEDVPPHGWAITERV